MQGSCRCILAIVAAVAGLLSGDARAQDAPLPPGDELRVASRPCNCPRCRRLPLHSRAQCPCPQANQAPLPPELSEPAKPDAPPEPAPPLPQITPSLNNSYGLVDAQSSVPWMMGDFFGNSCVPIHLGMQNRFRNSLTPPPPPSSSGPPELGPPPPPQYDPGTNIFLQPGNFNYDICLSSPSNGGVVGSTKFAENNSPLPRDRVFGIYDFFTDVPLQMESTNVNRLAPGFESTFWNGQASFEMRTPFAVTRDPRQNIDPTTASGVSSKDSTLQFGNIALTSKFLLLQSQQWAWTSGLGLTAPTAQSSKLYNNGVEFFRLQNDAFHLQPYLAALYTPNQDFFFQGVVQVDVASHGNRVFIDDGTGTMQMVGRLSDQTFLYISPMVGYWIARNDRIRSGLNGWALTAELHFNRSLTDSSVMNTTIGPNNTQLSLGSSGQNVELMNLMLGSTWRYANGLYVTAGYGTPLGGGGDRQFNGQFRLMANWLFGPGSPSPFAFN